MNRINKFVSTANQVFSSYQPFILFSIITLGGLSFLGTFQYFNLFLGYENMLILYWILAVIFFRIPARISFLLTFCFLLLAFIASLLTFDTVAEQAGKIIYLLVLIGFIQNFISYLETQ